MAGWRERIGRMGNHYVNEAGLNHTVPMIICWEEPRLLGSLVCSTAGRFFFVFSPTDFSLFCFFFPILKCSHLLALSLLMCMRYWIWDAYCYHRPTACMDFKIRLTAVKPFIFTQTAHIQFITVREPALPQQRSAIVGPI